MFPEERRSKTLQLNGRAAISASLGAQWNGHVVT